MIRICTNGCIGSTCRRCSSGAHNDRLFPKDYALAYQRLIPGSKVEIIPDCGHLPQVEQRQAFVSALEGFLVNRRAAA